MAKKSLQKLSFETKNGRKVVCCSSIIKLSLSYSWRRINELNIKTLFATQKYQGVRVFQVCKLYPVDNAGSRRCKKSLEEV